MGRPLDEDEVRCAKLVLSRYFELDGTRKVPAQAAIQYGKASGLHRPEIKEARKRLGIESVNEEGAYWWVWADGVNPGEVNSKLSEEVMENAGKEN